MSKSKFKYICNIPYSSKIDIENIENKFYIKINNPIANMQNNDADFEAIIIALKCKNLEAKFEIKFDEDKTHWNGRFDTTDNGVNTYLRFLYRVIRFQEAFSDWVDIANDNKRIVEKFKNSFEQSKENLKISNNIPIKKADEWKETMKEEKSIETKLTHTEEGKEYLKEICRKNEPKIELTDKIYNQLPNGLFNISNNEVPHKGNRIFSTGALDIWSIDKIGNLCIFELKKDEGNEKLGVISELFFYTVYAKEFLCNKELLHEKKKKVNFRGYDELYDAIQKNEIKHVIGIFLLGKKTHSVIQDMKEEITSLLNTNKFGIKFMFKEYDINRIHKINV